MIRFKVAPPIKSLVAELNALKEGLGEKGIRAALVYGAKPVTDTMRQDARADFGALRKSIGTRNFSKSERTKLALKEGGAALFVGTAKKVDEQRRKADGSITSKKRYQDYKAWWMEAGVKPHRLGGRVATRRRRADKPLAFNGVFRKRALHPGVKAVPFIGTALSKSGNAMAGRFYEGLTQYLEKQRAKRHPGPAAS